MIRLPLHVRAILKFIFMPHRITFKWQQVSTDYFERLLRVFFFELFKITNRKNVPSVVCNETNSLNCFIEFKIDDEIFAFCSSPGSFYEKKISRKMVLFKQLFLFHIERKHSSGKRKNTFSSNPHL